MSQRMSGQFTPTPERKRENPFRTWKRDLLLAVVVYVLLELTAWLAILQRPAGTAFILTPRGWGTLFNFLGTVIFITLVYIVCTVSAFAVRPAIAFLLRLFMLLLMLVFPAFVIHSKAVAVVRTESRFVFVRPFPFGPIEFPLNGLPPVQIDDTGWVRSLSVGGRTPDRVESDVECEPIWHGDDQTNQILDELAKALKPSKSN